MKIVFSKDETFVNESIYLAIYNCCIDKKDEGSIKEYWGVMAYRMCKQLGYGFRIKSVN